VHCIAAMHHQPRIEASVGTVEVVGCERLVDRLQRPGARLTVQDVEHLAAVARDWFPVIVDPEDGPSALQLDIEDEPAPLFDLDEFHRGLLHLDEAPIETWMSFLDPAQAKIARRSFNGPARIRGAAGTGKTVVGLHRTAHLARAATSTVLVTTYVKTFPAVLKSLLHRMEPTHASKVEFASAHAIARGILVERGYAPRIAKPQQITDAFGEAWSDLRRSPLRGTRFELPYWREEIAHVIKGRGLDDFDEYATLARVGRKYALSVELRRHVWELAEVYERKLRAAGVIDWTDVARMARDELRDRPLDRYEAIVIDEAQDLDCVTVGMLHALVGDRRDGLTLIGDGQQSIYPGGYTLGEVGISLAGRGVVLDINHRNTRQIAHFARRLVKDDIVTDIEGTDAAGDTVAAITRTGPEPVLKRFVGTRDHDRALVAVLEATKHLGVRAGDIGVLTPTKETVKRIIGVLQRQRIPVMSIEEYTGQTTNHVKVGTIKRAKGLEFKHVFLADVPPRLLEDTTGSESESLLERRRLDLRELYVGMTRARDELWVGVLG
jgi:superfamily I DNA/RNA helicase